MRFWSIAARSDTQYNGALPSLLSGPQSAERAAGWRTMLATLADGKLTCMMMLTSAPGGQLGGAPLLSGVSACLASLRMEAPDVDNKEGQANHCLCLRWAKRYLKVFRCVLMCTRPLPKSHDVA